MRDRQENTSRIVATSEVHTWEQVRCPETGALLFLYDPRTNEVQIRTRRHGRVIETRVKLDQYHERVVR